MFSDENIRESKDESCCDNSYLIKDLVKALEEAYRIIEDVEWASKDDWCCSCCPCCGEIKRYHMKDCKLKKFLDDRGKL